MHKKFAKKNVHKIHSRKKISAQKKNSRKTMHKKNHEK